MEQLGSLSIDIHEILYKSFTKVFPPISSLVKYDRRTYTSMEELHMFVLLSCYLWEMKINPSKAETKETANDLTWHGAIGVSSA
jgi:hypothetical protein